MLLNIEHSRQATKGRRVTPKKVFQKRPPSELMLPSDGRRYRCDWIERGITVHSDGNVSCGLDDPHASRSFGNINGSEVSEIFNHPEYDRVRDKLWAGSRCFPCSLYQEVEGGIEGLPARQSAPTVLVVEPSVRCNIRCENDTCAVNNDKSLATREVDDLDMGSFTDLIDEIGPGLEQVYFFNYGDPFMNRSAEDMLLHLRKKCATANIVTSTNGIPLMKPERAAKVVASKVDQITFTISGVTQESYVRYHANGRVDQALKGLQNVCAGRNGSKATRVEWRYLVFNWNDSFEEIDQAIALAEKYGVDRFTLMVTHIPYESATWRLAPGTPGFERYRHHIEMAYGYTDPHLPDRDGLYHVEAIPGVGVAQWTSYRSKMVLPEIDGALRMSIMTNRADSAPQPRSVLIRTPWQVYRASYEAQRWSEVAIAVPAGVQGLGPFPIEVLTEDAWFPVDELKNGDRRCLGVLIDRSPERVTSTLHHGSPDDVAMFQVRS